MTLSKHIQVLSAGQKYGSWTVLNFSHISRNKGKNAYWNCQCVCGTVKSISGSSLRRGQSTQCKACHGRTQMRTIKYKAASSDLYMMRCGPYVKIGSTNDVEQRLRSIQSACPYPVKLIGLWKGDGHKEEKWHNTLKHLHHTGEWYKLGGSCEI